MIILFILKSFTFEQMAEDVHVFRIKDEQIVENIDCKKWLNLKIINGN